MEVESVRLSKSWDGREYVVLHAGLGFYFHESRFTNAIKEGDDFCILWNRDLDIDPKLLATIRNSVMKRRKKEAVK